MKIDFRSSQCRVWHGDLASLVELELSLITEYVLLVRLEDNQIIKLVLYDVLSVPHNWTKYINCRGGSHTTAWSALVVRKQEHDVGARS